MSCFFQKLWRVFLDGLFPAYCLGCKAEGKFMCTGCLKTLPRLKSQMCPWCYAPDRAGRSCGACLDGGKTGYDNHFLDGLMVGTRFEEHSLLQRAIHQLKYDFTVELSEPLGRFLYETFLDLIREAPENHYLLCPLPLHPDREKWRGFNQAELLCSTILRRAGEAGFSNIIQANFLERVHFSKPQMELGREQRLVNVRDAFRIREGDASAHKNVTVVLVDDIATTLSTLNHAAAPLKKAGFERVYGLVLARVF